MDQIPRKNTPSDSKSNPDSHVKPNDTEKLKPTPEIPDQVAKKPEVGRDLPDEEWKDNPGRQPERELPNELYNETLPPDTRLI